MDVWVMTGVDYDDYSVYGVFSSPDAAQAAIMRWNETSEVAIVRSEPTWIEYRATRTVGDGHRAIFGYSMELVTIDDEAA